MLYLIIASNISTTGSVHINGLREWINREYGKEYGIQNFILY